MSRLLMERVVALVAEWISLERDAQTEGALNVGF